MPSPGLAVKTEQRHTPTLVAVDGRGYPLRSVEIRAHAEGGLASTTLIQRLGNPYVEALEVTYTMPLPADGAVLGYSVRMGERVIRGEIEPREKAAEAYRAALYEGRTAGLLEQDRADTFHQSLGNLPPRVDVEVEIQVLHPLAYLTGVGEAEPVWEYRFPTVVGTRYEGAPGRVIDAERLDADRDADGGIPTRASLVLQIADDTSAGTRASSPSHEIICTAEPPGTTIRLAERARLDRDVVIRWPAAQDGVGVRLVEGRGIPPDDGRYALLSITPPRVPQAAHHRDVTVLIDASGSMRGAPLSCAKGVVAGLLRSLEPDDRFEVIAFASSTHRLTRVPTRATEDAVHQCLQALDGLKGSGGTEMASAVAEALAPLRENAQRQIVLVTDGYIGFEAEVVGSVARARWVEVAREMRGVSAGVRVHAVGIGWAPNRSLTAAVARAGRGVELHVADEQGVADAVGRLRRATVHPVLTALRIGGAGVRLSPERPRDIFAGQPLIIPVELNRAGGSLEVHGLLAGAKEPWRWHTEIPASDSTVATTSAALTKTPLPIGALYARELVADVELQRAQNPERARSFDRRIEDIALQHRVTSRCTSLVAIAEEPGVNPLAARRHERLPVEVPAGVSAEGAELGAGPDQLTMAKPRGTVDIETLVSAFTQRALLRRQERERQTQWRALGETRSLDLRGAREDTSFIRARAISVRGPEAVVELEVPADGLVLPTGEVDVRVGQTADRDEGKPSVEFQKAQLLTDKSVSGPCRPGAVIRLAFELLGKQAWPQGPVILRWRAPDGARGQYVELVVAPFSGPLDRSA